MKGYCSDLTREIITREILNESSFGGSSDSSLTVDNGELWVYDTTRTKWLSSYSFTFTAGEKGRTRNKYLLLFDGQASNLSGYRLPRDGTITLVSAQTRSTGTWDLEIRKNNTDTAIATLSMIDVRGNNSTLNVDVEAGDTIHFYANTSGLLGVRDPAVWIEVKWRNDSLSAP